MEIKKISPSQVVKFLFPDAYKDVPEWILEKAADFGKDLHESIQTYIEQPDLDNEIKEALIADNKIRLYEAFKEWFKEQKIEEPKTEYYLETKELHGYIDLISFKNNKLWDYKFRNVDKKLDILKEIIQIKIYENMLFNLYEKWFDWELIIFDKKTAKIFKFSRETLGGILDKKLDLLIDKAINLLIEKQNIQLEPIDKDKLIKWEATNGNK